MIEFEGDIFDTAEDVGFKSPREFADAVASALRMKDGVLEWYNREFTAEGTLENGSTLYINQRGEYDMYGGPYDPKMQCPEIIVNDVEFPLSLIIDELENAGVEIGWGGNKNFPDLPSLADEWGHLLLLKDSTIKAKILGLI